MAQISLLRRVLLVAVFVGIYNMLILPDDRTFDEVITFHMTGAVTPTFDFPVTFSRIAKTVVMQWGDFTKIRNSLDQLFTADLVPSQFLPTFINSPVWPVQIVDGNENTDFSTGIISFGPSGNIVISRADFSVFSNTHVGIFGSSITYIV